MGSSVAKKSDVVNNSLHSSTSNAYGRETVQGSLGVHDSTGAFHFSGSPALPLGFISTCKTQTKDFDSVLVNSRFRALASMTPPEKRRFLLSHTIERQKFVMDNEPKMSTRIGFKVRTYASGEVTAGLYHTGRKSVMSLPPRSGELESTELTPRGRTKIRRCIECAPDFMRYFWTLTFSPEHLKPWQLDRQAQNSDYGPSFLDTVRHDFAKYKLKKFLDTARHQQKRLGRELLYVWVAEIQTEKTQNIHFHLLVNQFLSVKWVTKVWAQASNSVHIAEPLRTPEHASAYMRKYMTKDENSLIKGFRYQASNGLHLGAKPRERDLISMTKNDHHEEDGESVRALLSSLHALKQDIESRGGKVFDYGFSIPKARSARKWKNKQTGAVGEVPGVDARLGKQIAAILGEKMNKTGKIPF